MEIEEMINLNKELLSHLPQVGDISLAHQQALQSTLTILEQLQKVGSGLLPKEKDEKPEQEEWEQNHNYNERCLENKGHNACREEIKLRLVKNLEKVLNKVIDNPPNIITILDDVEQPIKTPIWAVIGKKRLIQAIFEMIGGEK